MKQLAEDIICEDGVATAAILEASDRLMELQNYNIHLISENERLKELSYNKRETDEDA
jgi:hypothetical protein